MRAVCDVNVLISALLAPTGTPATVLRAWIEGEFELVVSPRLLAELERALGYRKLRERIREDERERFIEGLRASAAVVDDPSITPPIRSPDPGDDYLIALAASSGSVLVTGDNDLLELVGDMRILSPAAFLQRL